MLRWKVGLTGGEVYFCDEEDDLWLLRSDIGTQAVTTLEAYLQSHGLPRVPAREVIIAEENPGPADGGRDIGVDALRVVRDHDTPGNQGMRMGCPACAEGTVLRVKYRRSGGVVAQCDACPALWLTMRCIDGGFFLDQSVYRAAHGLTGLRGEIQWIDDDWVGNVEVGMFNGGTWRDPPATYRPTETNQ